MRSVKIFVGVVGALSLAMGFAMPAPAVEFVKSGDASTISITITNPSDSTDDISGAAISASVVQPAFAPYFVVDQAGSILGPATIAKGQSQTFVVKYTIGPNAPTGSFDVVLLATSTTDGVLPAIGTFDADSNIQETVVSFPRSRLPSLVEKSV